MPRHDDLIARIERFNDSRGGGVVTAVEAIRLYSRRQAVFAMTRHKPVGESDRWANAAPLGGIILPLDDAPKFITNEPVFWT